MSVSKSANNQDNKPRPAISSKKLCLSNKSLQKEVLDSANRLEDTVGDLDAQKVNMPDVKKGCDMHWIGIGGKLDVSGSKTRDRDMGLKRAPSNESLECRKDHVMNVKNSDHDQHTKRLIISSKKLCLSNKNLQKETDIPEYAVGSKRLSGIGRKVSLDASASNTRVIDMGMNTAPPNKSQNQEPNQDSKPPAVSSKKLSERSDEDISEQEGSGDSESVIVLDSEDSEEETARSSSRRLISQRRLTGKI
nr:probable ubiquitin-conjugating enzyme E2 37 [Tanacetum cinerariifolium]